MTNFNVKLGSAVAIATFVASVLAPAGLADTTINVTDNGVASNNTVNVNNGSKTTINQTNGSEVVTNVSAKSDTGGNSANFNTGGTNSIVTGNATTNVTVSVGGSSNTATPPQCGCKANTTVDVSGNGDASNNAVNVNNKTKFKVNQLNSSVIVSDIKAKAKTGNNSTSWNTGSGTGITTGHAGTNVTVNVTGSNNTQL